MPRFQTPINFLFSTRETTTEGDKCLASTPMTMCVFHISTSAQADRLSPQKLIFESSEAVSVISTFDDLGLKEDLLRGIYAYSAYSVPLSFLSRSLTRGTVQILKSPPRFSSVRSSL
jgi:hypothetical protein